MLRMSIANLFESRKNDPRWNTSYPLSPTDWAKFRTSSPLAFDNDQTLSFYLHIPFCRQLCSFCEYTKMLVPDEHLQERYLRSVAHDIERFKSLYGNLTLQGFDIGGGTPTSLSESNFSLLMDIYQRAIAGLALSRHYEPSIEGTFNTLTETKLSDIVRNGIYRLSLGVQSSCHSIMKSHGRENAEERQMQAWIDKAREIGIEKINLDFMYGIHGQDESSIEKDLQLIKLLHPQQVTLYELRTNMIPSAKTYPKETLYDQYSHYYDRLINMGYVARFGQNTFSVDADDQGVSSYIRERMINGAPYRGFGISAQSMCSAGVSYNKGKNQPIQHLLNDTSYPEEYTYRLPSNELASKYIAISAYNGSFSVDRLKELCYYDTIKETIDFCLDNDLLELHNNRAYITRKGFKHYGAVFSLIHSPR